jgi:hypothetical protein
MFHMLDGIYQVHVDAEAQNLANDIIVLKTSDTAFVPAEEAIVFGEIAVDVNHLLCRRHFELIISPLTRVFAGSQALPLYSNNLISLSEGDYFSEFAGNVQNHCPHLL